MQVNYVFAVYDSKAGYFKNPFMMRSHGEAVRGFSDLVNDINTEVGRHPEDFTLFKLGEWNSENGKYENEATPVSLGVGVEFKIIPLTQVVKNLNGKEEN